MSTRCKTMGWRHCRKKYLFKPFQPFKTLKSLRTSEHDLNGLNYLNVLNGFIRWSD
jgi:hypothetical protein